MCGYTPPDHHPAASQSQSLTYSVERMYIEAYLKSKGFTLSSLKDLDPAEARKLRIEASIYASSKLAEVETRARMLAEIDHPWGYLF